MSAMQIANMSLEQFNKLTAEEAKIALSKVRKRVNERLRSLDKELDYSTPAIEALKKAHPEKKARLMPSASGKNARNENLSELKKGIDFLKNKTSFKQGGIQHFEKTRKYLGLSENATADEVKEIYKDFHKIQEEFGGVMNKESGAEKYAAVKAAYGKWREEGYTNEDVKSSIRKFYERSQADAEATADSIISQLDKELYIKYHEQDTDEDNEIQF